jgi:hypothetical protein
LILKPETVLRRRREGFKLFRTRLSRRRRKQLGGDVWADRRGHGLRAPSARY